MTWLCLIRRNVAQLLNFYVQVKFFKKGCFKCACIVRIKNYKLPVNICYTNTEHTF